MPARIRNFHDRCTLAASTFSDFGQIVAIDEGDGIEQLTLEDKTAFTNPTVYDLGGRCTTKEQKGIQILRSADGRAKKVYRK